MPLKHRLTKVYDVFSLRQVSGESNYKIDKVSDRLRRRVLLLFRDVVSGRWGQGDAATAHEFWQDMHNSLQHLYGRPNLSRLSTNSAMDDAIEFLLGCSTDEFFDFIELSFKLDCAWRAIGDEDQFVEAINKVFEVENAPYRLTPISKTVDAEVNRRGPPPWGTVRVLAYPKVIRTDDEVIHREAIEPTLSVLSAPHFSEANLRFREALDHYRKGAYDDCLTKCGTSLESVCKVICSKKRWPYTEDDNISQVLKTVIRESDLESFYESPLMLIATIRNKLSSSHGKGTAIPSVKRHTAQFALNSTAAAILLLVHECEV